MNLIDAEVIDVLGEPQFESYTDDVYKLEWWEVKVRTVDMGGEQIESLTFKTKEEAEGVKVGYQFIH